MESILKNQRTLLFFKNLIASYKISLFSVSYLIFLLSLYMTTDVLKNNVKELVDLFLEILVIFLSFIYIYILILYNKTFNLLKSITDKEDDLFEHTSFFVKKYNFDNFLKREQNEHWNNNFLFFFIAPFLFIILGNFNIDINTSVTGKDVIYALVLLLFVFLINIFIHNLLAGFEFILNEKIISKKTYSKSGIESYIIEIREHLNIFNRTSIFRQRVEEAIKSITEIYLINKSSLERLQNDIELSSKIIHKNNILETELRQMLFSIIEYNNERNETILNNINKNISIINSLRN